MGTPDDSLDRTDRLLLEILQEDARASQAVIGARIGLSAAAVNRRVRRLTEAGVITGTVVTVAPEKVGRRVTVIAQIAVENEQPQHLDQVRESFLACPQVQQCYYVAGEWDFILVLTVSDMAEYTSLTRELFFADGNVRRFNTSVVMDRVKVSLAVPAGGRNTV
jgi:Lrp/AsnC family leucine-responsive transcriptional regulator